MLYIYFPLIKIGIMIFKLNVWIQLSSIKFQHQKRCFQLNTNLRTNNIKDDRNPRRSNKINFWILEFLIAHKLCEVIIYHIKTCGYMHYFDFWFASLPHSFYTLCGWRWGRKIVISPQPEHDLRILSHS